MGYGDRVARYAADTGELRYESACWDSIRSDTHQISVRVGSDALWMRGSPARVIGRGDAAFGAGASRALDPVGCLERMRASVSERLGVGLPVARHWTVSRVDVTAYERELFSVWR